MNFLIFILTIKSMVLKTGSDRPVGPVQPPTGELSGSVRSMSRFVIKPALNRSNRRLDRRTGWPVRFFANRSLLKQFFLLWKSHSRPSLVAFFYYEKATKAQSNEKTKTYNLGHVYKPNMQHSLFKNNTCNSGHASRPSLVACLA